MTINEIKIMFEQWWLLEGQYKCASGQPNHKETILTAWISGWNQCGFAAESEKLAKSESWPLGAVPDHFLYNHDSVCNVCGCTLRGDSETASGMCTAHANEDFLKL